MTSLAQPWPLALIIDYVLTDNKPLPDAVPALLEDKAILLAGIAFLIVLIFTVTQERRLIPALPAPEARAGDRLRHARGPLREGPRPRARLPRQEAHRGHHNPRHQRRERGTHHAGRLGGRGVLLGHDPARYVGRDALARLAAYPARPRHRALPVPRRQALQAGARAADAHSQDEGGRHRQRHAGGHNRYKGRQALRPRGRRDGALQEGEQGVTQGQRGQRDDRGQVQHRTRDRRRPRHGAGGVLRGEAGPLRRPLLGRPYRLRGLPRPVSLAPVGPEPAGEPDRHVTRLGRAHHRALERGADREGSCPEPVLRQRSTAG